MGEDEERTHASLTAHLRELVEPCIAEHRGRVVKRTGDALLAEFSSVLDAARCSLAVQAGMRERNASAPIDRRIEFRIGVNIGDVIVEGDDIFGDGVNVAARLESLAEPGGVCISGDAYRQIRNRLELNVTDLGDQRLKNITEPVRVYKLRLTEELQACFAEAHAVSLPDKPSIAVLPFDNLSNQPEETYFSDGITEEILTGLARFRSLSVVASNSSFSFRSKPVELAEIGRKLGASYLLEGTVRRAGERVRITAQLIEAATGIHVWADRYDRSLEDIFAVQDEVARMIVSTLVGQIEEARLKQSFRKPTGSLAAYDCLLRGMAHFRGYAEDDNRKACEMFERAVALDPQFALAHAYLAIATLGVHGHAAAPPEALDAALETASYALELDPQESRCHRAVAQNWLYRRDFDMAEYHFRKALELNPNDADRIIGVGYLLALRGHAEEALGWIEAAVRLNPFHHTWYNSQRGVALYSLRRFTEAEREFRKAPHRGYWSRARLAACYGQLGQTAEAETQRVEILRLKPDFSTEDFLRRDVLLERAEDRELLREGLIKAGLPE
jgi:TolB-like protein/Tfp pilus assembly protein PilF